MGQQLIERASVIDMMELASATTPAAGQIGAVLVLEPGRVDLETVRSAIDERIRGVPRLSQRLHPTPLGCGRPVWVDHGGFDIAEHVREVRCPQPGDREALLGVAAELVATHLPPDRPLWTAALVTGCADDATALVIVFHHVMADGIGGLAVLANLVDGPPTPPTPEFPRPAPSTTALLSDAVQSRLSTLTRPGSLMAHLRAAAGELRARPPKAPRSSINAPVGPTRCLAVATEDLQRIHAAARRHGVSVNDAVLAAITGAVRRFLADRGETVDELVVSIPVSSRGEAAAGELGNRIGIMAVELPAGGEPGERMEVIGAITRARKQEARGASAALLAPAFRGLAAVGALRWFTEHQHMVNTFVTNLRGPDSTVDFGGRRVEELIPINSTSGNVRVAFGVFSYAGALTVTVVADGSLADDLAALVDHLRAELGAVAAEARPPRRPT